MNIFQSNFTALLMLYIALNCFDCSAQSYIQCKYGSNQYSEKNNKGVTIDEKLFIVTDTRENSTRNSSLRILTMDTSLIIQNSKDFRSAGALQCMNIIALQDSNLLVIGRCIDTVNNSNELSTVLLQLNAQLDTIWTNRIFKSNSDADFDYVSNSADSIILFGTIGNQPDATAKPAFVFIDKHSGNLYGIREFDTDSLNGGLVGVQSIYLNYDSCFYSVCLFKDTVTYSDKILLSKFDHEFNSVKSILLENNIGYLTGIIQMNSKILISYSVYLPGYDACLTQFDTSLTIQWSQKYGGPIYDEIFRNGLYNSFDKIEFGLFEKIVSLDSTGYLERIFPVIDYNISPFSSCQLNHIIPFSKINSYFLSSIITLGNSTEDMLISKSRPDGFGCSTNGFSIPSVSRIVSSQTITNINLIDSLETAKDITLSIDSASMINICSASQHLVALSDNHSVKLYPNPASEKIFIYPGDSQVDLKSIHDVYGKLIIDLSNQNKLLYDGIDVSSLDPGIFFANYSIINSNIDNIQCIKFIKQ